MQILVTQAIFYDFFCVLIGLGLQYFDRMCASCLLFPRCKKSILAKSRVTRFCHPTDDMLVANCAFTYVFFFSNKNLDMGILEHVH